MAIDVRFWDFPGVLQANSHIQLQMTLPADEVDAVVAKAQAEAVEVYEGGVERSKFAGLPFVADLMLYGKRWRDPEVPPVGFTVFVLEQSNGWNHPRWRIVAVNPATRRVVYDASVG